MSQLLALLLATLHYGTAHAADIQDAPIPEPNYLGIAIFFSICIGCCWWFYKAVMKNSAQTKSVESKVLGRDKS